MTATGFTTIGHSNRDLNEFIAMLRSAEVGLVTDIRAFPRSRSHPAYNIESLPAALESAGIGYRHQPALGGRRGRQTGVDPALNALWRVQSFHNYADYALGEPFSAALNQVERQGAERRLALMCAEALWWRCHRRIITDYLLFDGHPVDHLMAPGKTAQAAPTPGAVRTDMGKVVYPGGGTRHPPV